MNEPHQTNGTFQADIENMRKQFTVAMQCCQDYPGTIDQEISPDALNDSMLQLFDILETLAQEDGQAAGLLQHEINNLPEYGLGLLAKLVEYAQLTGCQESSTSFEKLTIELAAWFARQELIIDDIEILVNAISNTADRTHNHQQLAELVKIINVITEVISPEIKTDSDKSNPGRPWRVLNLNQAIIATRSLDPALMESVFEQLVFRLPEDAPGFFAEGMEQMEIIDYPDHVRNVMQTYYQMTNQPTLH
jgi:hypothetical protein